MIVIKPASYSTTVAGVTTPGCTVWITGLSGAGKTTSAYALRDALAQHSRACLVIDGDDLRRGLSSDLGFSSADRDENVRRAGELALLANAQGLVAIVSLISPRSFARRAVRMLHDSAAARFIEVYIATPLEICEQRDPKALYRRARSGEQFLMTGVDDPYETPEHAELVVSTEHATPESVGATILSAVLGA
jgi:bifunctional enzyme CysN/CysC